MVEQAQQHIQKAVTSLIDDLDCTFLRGMQKNMHLCAAQCCDKEDSNVESLHRCIENCSTPLNQAQNFIMNELTQFKERLHRCVLVCEDKVRDKVNANTTEAQVNIYKAELGACTMECVEEHIKLMPSTKKRITDVLNKKS